MSRYFLMGGFAGFALTFFSTLSAGADIHVALRNGMIGCLVLAFLAGRLSRLVAEICVRNKLRELARIQAEEAKEEEMV